MVQAASAGRCAGADACLCGREPGKLTITIAEPVGPAGQPTAVVGTDMHLDTVTKKVAAIRPISKSFAFLMDGEGKLLAHPKADLALKPASEIAKGIDAGMLPSWLLTARVPMC
mgnify:CR=1 FL=1